MRRKPLAEVHVGEERRIYLETQFGNLVAFLQDIVLLTTWHYCTDLSPLVPALCSPAGREGARPEASVSSGCNP